MGQPAARLGDMTAHGGSIVLGSPMVLIGGMPAARVGDMHVCPMLTPGVPPIPHVGGPILPPGSPMVLIGGMPAARLGDMATCVGPPSTIVMGCMTVLIGAGGGGSSSGGGAGMSASGAAQMSASAATSHRNESTTKDEHWVEFQFTDKAGNAVNGIPYKFTAADGTESEGTLQIDGRVARDGMSQGQCSVQLYGLSGAKWSKDTAKAGDKVKMSAAVEGYDGGTKAQFLVYRRDFSGPDRVTDSLDATTQGDKVEAEWTYVQQGKAPGAGADEGEQGYSHPEFYFEVIVGRCVARSPMLRYEDWIEIELKDENGKAMANEEYVLYLPDGSLRKGKLDGSGRKKEDKIPAGMCSVKFPNLPAFK